MGTKQNRQSGQSLIEYLILVAFMAIASIGIVRVLGQNLTARYSEISHLLGTGNKKKYKSGRVEDSHYSRKSFSNFINGAGSVQRDKSSGN